MKVKAAIVTGCNGDIGKAVSEHLNKNDFFVIGIDKLGKKNKYIDKYLKFDFNKIVMDSEHQKSFKKELLKSLNKFKLELLVNNAAVQQLSHKNTNTNINKLVESYNVNAISPGVVDGEHWAGVDAFFAKLENKPLGQKKQEVGAAVPFGRMGTAQDLTGMAIFLASQDAEYIVAQTYNVDGGNWMS